jgi:tetratricopeptide (TPR) repeat protein
MIDSILWLRTKQPQDGFSVRLHMKPISVILLISIVGVTILAQGQATQTSPAEDRIAFISREITKNPAKSNLHTELAIARMLRERETSDTAMFDQVQAALDKSLKLAPANFETKKVEAALLLGKHEFAKALTLAQSLNEQVPDDVMTYGYIADADLALGDYADAEKAAQWMLDLRSHNVPGLIRGAELRQIFGDPEGALEFLGDVYQQTSPDQLEDLAWRATRIAEINLAIGKLDLADQWLHKALASFPKYYFSLEVQARVLETRHKYGEAADILHLRNQHFPQPESIYAEAEALEHSGNAGKAKELYINFEQVALSKSSLPDNDNRDLVLYYLGQKHDFSAALRIAPLAISQRHDVWTLDSLACALYANGHYLEAQKQIEKAMAVGIRDGNIFYHAAQINAALKNQAATVQYLKSSLEANPQSGVSDTARKMLAGFAEPEYGTRR